MKTIVIVAVYLLSFGSNVSFAQATEQKPITNADVVAMVRAQLEENTIIGVIQRSVSNFDLAVASIISLKNEHVPEAIIQAMVSKSAPQASGKPRNALIEEATARGYIASVPSITSGLGQVQYKGANGLVALRHPAIHDTKIDSGGVVGIIKGPFSSTDTINVYDGAHASLQIGERTPTFLLRAIQTEEEILIVRLDQKSSRREMVTGKVTAFGHNSVGIPEKLRKEVTITKQADGSMIFSPKKPLADGEYMITMGFSGAGPMYEFGIVVPK